MENSGTIKTSISLSAELWNEIQKELNNDEMSFSRWVQKSSRLLLQTKKKRKVKEFYESLDEKEMNLLKEEIKKKG